MALAPEYILDSEKNSAIAFASSSDSGRGGRFSTTDIVFLADLKIVNKLSVTKASMVLKSGFAKASIPR